MSAVTSPLPAPRAVLFDWDNTLAENWHSVARALAAAQRAMGQTPWNVAETRSRVRRSLRDSFPEMFGDQWPAARDIFYKTFREEHLDHLKPMPGAEAVFAHLSRAGVYMAVVSNKTGPLLRKEVDALGWGKWFTRVVGATDAARDKPAPEAVALALDGSGIAPARDVWLVGDTDIDMECAGACGCGAVLVTAGGGAGASDPALLALADLVVADLETLAGHLAASL